MPDSSSIYQKFRNSDDQAGNLAWTQKQNHKALRLSTDPHLQDQIVRLDLSTNERALISLLTLPRTVNALIDCELMHQDELRSMLRALHAADLVELLDADQARALVPVEIKRAKAAAAGKTKPTKKDPKRLQARVYRPSIAGLGNEEQSDPQAFVPEGLITGGDAANLAPANVITQAPSQDDEAYEKELGDIWQRIKNFNYFEVLGLLSDAADADVKKAYFDRAKRYHPDALAGHRFKDPDLVRKRVKAIFEKITAAYQVLQNSESRQEYRHRLKAGLENNSAHSGRRRRPGEAHMQSKKAMVLLQKKDYAQARRMFTIAGELDHEDPIYPSYAAWCHYFDTSVDKEKRTQQATQQLQDLLKKKEHAQAAYFLGMIYKLTERKPEAIEMFNLVLSLDPLHSEAARELRLEEQREQREAQRKADGKSSTSGFWGKLLKR